MVNRIPPGEHEDSAAVARAGIGLDSPRRKLAIAGMFLIGGVVL